VTTPVPGMLPSFVATAVMVGYAAVALALGGAALSRRDV